jgi:hypothetical protein
LHRDRDIPSARLLAPIGVRKKRFDGRIGADVLCSRFPERLLGVERTQLVQIAEATAIRAEHAQVADEPLDRRQS